MVGALLVLDSDGRRIAAKVRQHPPALKAARRAGFQCSAAPSPVPEDG